jgi:membrane dipeptidase
MSEPLLESLIWDNHACMPLRPGDVTFLDRLTAVHAAGVDVVSLNVSTAKQRYQFAVSVLETYRTWIEERSDRFLIVSSAADAMLAHATNRLGVCFDVEGADVLESDPENVARLYDLGVRWMLLVYNTRNEFGCGCMVEDDGVTPLGRRVVAEMNRVGMVVCTSHGGYRTAREIIDASSAPVIFSHSNPKAVWDHPRNISDELMRACAKRGGVIGINGFGPFLGRNEPGTRRFVDHLLYTLDLVGPDHVGIALDYVFDVAELDAFITANPAAFPPQYFQSGAHMVGHDQMKDIVQAVRARGYGPHELANIFGCNHLRIAQTLWRRPGGVTADD